MVKNKQEADWHALAQKANALHATLDGRRKSHNIQLRVQPQASLWLPVQKCSLSESAIARHMRAFLRNVVQEVTLYESRQAANCP